VSWHFLQGQEVASWEGSCWAGAPSALSRLMPFAGACCSRDSATACSSPSPSGMTSALSTASLGAATSMSSAGASPARTSRAPASVPASLGSAAGSGLSSLASLARFDPASRSWRTAQTSLLEDSKSFSVTWPRSGTMRDGTCWELVTLARRTGEIESGSWLPTPTGAGNEHSPSMQKWAGHRRLSKMLPTCLASDHKGQSSSGRNRDGHGGPRLTRSLATEAGYLAPGGVFTALREWMMGWPIGWTALGPLATDRFQQWLHSHGRP
jgi:hypothetical protein